MHKNNIIHRDIKTLNIFLTKDRKIKVKKIIFYIKNIFQVGDMGVSKIVNNMNALQGTRVGTPLYLAPECV